MTQANGTTTAKETQAQRLHRTCNPKEHRAILLPRLNVSNFVEHALCASSQPNQANQILQNQKPNERNNLNANTLLSLTFCFYVGGQQPALPFKLANNSVQTELGAKSLDILLVIAKQGHAKLD